MNKSMRNLILIITLLFPVAKVMASPAVDIMSDNEVSEYAIRMSSVLDKIRDGRLCITEDIRCISAEFARHGMSYADKEPVIKRLSIMIGSIH
jgi:hypothetical protein